MSKRTVIGVVTSLAGHETIVVTRTTRKTHPLYGKKYTTSRKFHVHDEAERAGVGDKVSIQESKPYAKTVTWELKDIIELAPERLEVNKTEIERELDEAAEGHHDKEAVEEQEEA